MDLDLPMNMIFAAIGNGNHRTIGMGIWVPSMDQGYRRSSMKTLRRTFLGPT